MRLLDSMSTQIQCPARVTGLAMDFADTGRFPAEQSRYLGFLRQEHNEILKVKWCESERAGRDVGMDYAVWSWSMRYRTAWISGLKARGEYPA